MSTSIVLIITIFLQFTYSWVYPTMLLHCKHRYDASIKISKYTVLTAVPLEIKDKINPTRTWNVKLIFKDQVKTVSVAEDESMLEVRERIFDDVPSSCRNGVCTTCAAQIVEGRENVTLAIHGLGKPQIDAGYACSCQTYVTGPGVVVKLGMYDEVYESQYGQYEKSYGELKYTTKTGESDGEKKKQEPEEHLQEEPKKKGWFW